MPSQSCHLHPHAWPAGTPTFGLMQTTNDIRAAFLDYFARHDHAVVPSSPLVPRNDPTLLFTNAGMVQFKNVFTGVEKRPYQRAVTSQKCVRAGGKHNDLENVGYTARHHTFFEMLGNFSFGDYFKERAIELAWNLIVKEFGLPKDKLLVTVYAEDEDAARLWAKIAGLPEQKIIRIATSDNFWAMGDTGPCGPCSEIFYDPGDGVLPSKEGRGYVLRRIMRRAMRHAHMLGCREPLMWRLVPALVQQMGAAFPELLRAQPLIAETLRFEEANFKQTLDRGLRLLEEQTGNYGGEAGPGLLKDRKTLAGTVAFALYDTYGFPLDLTQDILRGHGLQVDVDGFDREMNQARQRSRASWIGSGEAATDAVWFTLREEVGPTEFLGYETETAEGVILALLRGEERILEARSGDEIGVIVNQTPFYGESGGQVGDTGAIFSAGGGEFAVIDTLRKAGDLFVHIGSVTHGMLRVGDAVELRVD